MAFIITTTGVPGTVVIDDLGERTFVHPVVSYDLETEYTPFELSESADLQAAITGGEITAVDGSGNPITIVGQLMDLQSAYNSSTNPEIVTDATLEAVTIKRGSAADTDNVLETKNGAGSNTFEVTGAGKVTGTDFNDVALTTGGVATNYLDETGVYSAPASGGVTSVTGTTPIASSGGATPAISISAATTIAAGSMSSADKTKLDGIAAGAQPGTITAIAVTLPLTSTGGTAPLLNINTATVSLPGVMSSGDKTKLDGISADADKYYSQNLIDTTGGTINAPYGTPAILTSAANFYITVAETGTYIIYGSVNIDDDLNKDNNALELVYGIDPLGVGSPAIGPVPYQQNGQHKKDKRNGIQGTWLGVSLNATDRVHMYMSTCNGSCTWLGGRIFIAQWK